MQQKKHKLTQCMAGIGGVQNPLIGHISGPRAGMLGLEYGQAVSTATVDVPTLWGGYGDELANYTFASRVPADCLVISVHRKYNSPLNPLTVVIYQNINTGEYGVIEALSYWCEHQYFGSINRPTPILNNLMAGQRLIKGEYLNLSARVTDEGVYSSTLSRNTISCTDPASTEDGYKVSDKFCEDAAITTIRKYVTSSGRKEYFLNSYGDENNYMPFQKLGGAIRDDGLVFATHPYDELDIYRLTPKGLLKRWVATANTVYINDTFKPSESVPTVLDITVERGGGDSKRALNTPPMMRDQLDYYADEFNKFNEGIVEVYNKIIQNDSGSSMTPELNDTIFTALCKCDVNSPLRTAVAGNVKKLYNKYPVDEYRVEIVVKLTKKLERGAKMAGDSGDKGVICSIVPVDKMPRSSDGTVVHVCKMSKGAISRANPAQNIKGYIGAACRDYTTKVRQKVQNGVPYQKIFEELLLFYDCIDPAIRVYLNQYDSAGIKTHIDSICAKKIVVPRNIESPINPIVVIMLLEKNFPPVRERLSYINSKGEVELGDNEALIEVQDYMVLEQSYINPSAMGSSAPNIYGLAAKPSKPLKFIRPMKIKPTMTVSETEHRLYLGIMGKDYEGIIDMAANPDSQRAMIRTILQSASPAEIENVVDRVTHKLGQHRALLLFTNILAGVGLEIVNTDNLTEGKYE